MRKKEQSDTRSEAKSTEVKGTKIGLEIHCQLTRLRTKVFCGCSSNYRDKEPNTLICPICFGLPGSLPVLNEKALESGIKIALALNCKVATNTQFFRKNYFYPDLPKNFQISQYDKAGGIPIGSTGHIDVGSSRVRIRRVQLEEDPGKLTYEGTIDKSSFSLVDYNRSGVALVETVTEPDISSPQEARQLLETFRSTVESLGVCDGSLEGAIRCDANISFGGGKRVEVKNISSFKEVEKALSYEALRQGRFSQSRNLATNETRHWDERRSITIPLRSKAEEMDYRYFPETNIPPVVIRTDRLTKIESEMPEMTEHRLRRYVTSYGLSRETAMVLVGDSWLNKTFEKVLELHHGKGREKEAGNFVANDLRSTAERLGKVGAEINAEAFDDILDALHNKILTRQTAKKFIEAILVTGERIPELRNPKSSIAPPTFAVEEAARRLVRDVEDLYPDAFMAAKSDPNVINFLIGKIKQSHPNADMSSVSKVLREYLSEH